MRSMVVGAGAPPALTFKRSDVGRRVEHVRGCIAHAAAPSTAFGGPPPP
jgi:hypothetical protein